MKKNNYKNYLRILSLLCVVMSGLIIRADLQKTGITCVSERDASPDVARRVKDLSDNIFEVLGDYGYAISNERLSELMQKSLKAQPSLAHCAVDKYGNTLVHIAACRSMTENLEELVTTYNASTNAKNIWGLDPMDMLTLCSDTSGILLAKRKAELEGKYGTLGCKNAPLDTSLGQALRSGTPGLNILSLLGKYGKPLAQLTPKEWQEFEELVTIVVHKNPAIFTCPIDEYGNTIAHIAACHQAESLLKLALRNNMNLSTRNSWGFKPGELITLCEQHADR